jgi:excisionase family DNA binding protein
MASPTIQQWESLKNDRLLSIREIKDVIGQSAFTIRRWISEGKLSAVKIGGQLRCRQSAVLKLIRDQEK